MITVNKNTTQTPITSGRTGVQSVKFIPAPRVYLGPPDYSNPAPVVIGRSNGISPCGFTDLGVVDGAASVTLQRTTNPVFAGVDKLLKKVYSQSISAKIACSLCQFDDVVLEAVAGVLPSYSSPGVYDNYQLGKQNLTAVSLLLVSQNKLDGKEWQFYNPRALISFSFDNQSDDMCINLSGILPSFVGVGNTAAQILSVSIVNSEIPGYGWSGYSDLLYGG